MVCNKDGIKDNEHETLQKEKKRSRGVAPLCCKKQNNPIGNILLQKKEGTKAPLCYKKKKEFDSFLLKKEILLLFFYKTKKRTCKKKKQLCSFLLQKIQTMGVALFFLLKKKWNKYISITTCFGDGR